jgi:hypothetical protein
MHVILVAGWACCVTDEAVALLLRFGVGADRGSKGQSGVCKLAGGGCTPILHPDQRDTIVLKRINRSIPVTTPNSLSQAREVIEIILTEGCVRLQHGAASGHQGASHNQHPAPIHRSQPSMGRQPRRRSTARDAHCCTQQTAPTDPNPTHAYRPPRPLHPWFTITCALLEVAWRMRTSGRCV